MHLKCLNINLSYLLSDPYGEFKRSNTFFVSLWNNHNDCCMLKGRKLFGSYIKIWFVHFHWTPLNQFCSNNWHWTFPTHQYTSSHPLREIVRYCPVVSITVHQNFGDRSHLTIKIRVGCHFGHVLSISIRSPACISRDFSYLLIRQFCTGKNPHPIFLMIENPC